MNKLLLKVLRNPQLEHMPSQVWVEISRWVCPRRALGGVVGTGDRLCPSPGVGAPWAAQEMAVCTPVWKPWFGKFTERGSWIYSVI